MTIFRLKIDISGNFPPPPPYRDYLANSRVFNAKDRFSRDPPPPPPRRGDAFRIEISFALQWLILVELECDSNCNPLRIRFMLEFEQKNHPSKLFWWDFTVIININLDHLFCCPREFFRSANQNTHFLVRSLLCGSILRLRWIKPSLFCTDLGSMKTFQKFGSWRKLPVRE